MTQNSASIPSNLLAEAQMQLAGAAFSFIRRGLASEVEQDPSTQFLELALHHELAEKAMGGGLLFPDPRALRTPETWAQAVAFVHEHFVANFAKVAKNLRFDALPAPWICTLRSDEQVRKNIKELSGFEPLVSPGNSEGLSGEDLLTFCFRMAQYSRKRAEQRYVTLHVLAEMLRRRTSSNDLRNAPAQEELANCSRKLWSLTQEHERREFALALLIGGDVQAECIQRIQRSYGPGMSVMHLVTEDATHCASFRQADEDELYAAVAQAPAARVPA